MTTMRLHSTSSSNALTRHTRHTQHTRQSVSYRITMLLLIVCVLIVLWYFSELSLPGAVTGASYLEGCPSVIIHC
jgi:hypothetical protein